MVRSRLIGVPFALALTAGATVACSAEADPEAAPTSSVTTSVPPTTPTTDPTDDPTDDPEGPVEPALPAAARAPTRAGAEAFVRYYIDLLNYAGATGDTDAFEAAAKGCDSCANLAQNFRDTYENGGYYKTRGWRVETLFASVAGNLSSTAVAQVKETRITWRESEDARIRHLPADRVSLRFSMSRSDGSWQIRRFTRS